MQKRLFHKPLFHFPNSTTTKSTNSLEIFYDLIFAAAFIQIGKWLEYSYDLLVLAKIVALFVPLWISWFALILYSNRFSVDDILHRWLVFCYMFCIGILAALTPSLWQGTFYYFAITYSVSQFIIAAIYFRTFLQQPKGRNYTKYQTILFFINGAIWVASSQTPEYYYFFWIAGSLLFLLPPIYLFFKKSIRNLPIDLKYLNERFGFFTTILLGGSFVQVLSSINAINTDKTVFFQVTASLLLIFAIWWIYFDDIGNSEIKKKSSYLVMWIISHALLHFSAVILWISLDKFTFFPLEPEGSNNYSLFLTVSMGLFLISASVIDIASTRKNSEVHDRLRFNIRLFSGILILLMGLTYQIFNGIWLLSICLFICMFQIIFDILYSPYYYYKHVPQSDVSKSENNENLNTIKSERSSINLNPIRKGVPDKLKKDFYFYFIETSWFNLFTALFFIYLLINFFFAILYLANPNSILNGKLNSFFDAFFFSIQTMSTIGYGELSPNGLYSNLIVTLEAAIGLIGTALVTGIIFTKIARPKAKIIFSKYLLINTMNGQKTLCFRLGNTRGNDIIEAKVNLTALIEKETLEGEIIRKISTLKLIKNKTPFFNLSWSVYHVIDNSSPLTKEVLSSDRLLGIVVTISGHDGTYSKTVYSRHSYSPKDLIFDRYFEDVLKELPDGSLLVDYDKFNQLKPLNSF